MAMAGSFSDKSYQDMFMKKFTLMIFYKDRLQGIIFPNTQNLKENKEWTSLLNRIQEPI